MGRKTGISDFTWYSLPMQTEVPRNWRGQPMIVPPEGGKPVAYSRASSYGDALEDFSNLTKWKLRMAVKGMALLPHLYLAATATPLEDKRKLNDIAEEAINHAGGNARSSIGTSLHSLTEQLDRGEELPVIPPQYRADLEAYREATAGFHFVHTERFMACDELRVAGTPDRVAGFSGETEVAICDLKTGGDSRFLGRHAVQLALYSRSQLYDPSTGERSEIPDLSQEVGYIFHAPAGEGRCDVYRVDLDAGWDAALLAADVRAHRKRVNSFVQLERVKEVVA